ncbi:hypothetical protein FACS189451_12280 [Bacteroidia bacterium]|nr:hypothetical protein FACS189446_5890 [Bacteroidia bacterium]GHT64594.1 hypothetical protein FACS189451_12280 [Bacteroidia bacterium]
MIAKLKTYLFYACAILLVISAALYITDNRYIPYIYAVSGAVVAVAYLSNPYRGDSLRLKRLNIQQAIAAILLPVSSYLMFLKRNEWIATLFVSAILQLYVVIIRRREEK